MRSSRCHPVCNPRALLHPWPDPPCTDAILKAGIGRVVAAATDPNPRHAGKGFTLLRSAGLLVESGLMGEKATELNRFFNHWITNRLPYVTVKAAMTLDGKIATASGDSKWITGESARKISGCRTGL